MKCLLPRRARFRVLGAHQRANRRSLLPTRIDQMCTARFDVMVKLLELVVFRCDAGEAAFPRRTSSPHRRLEIDVVGMSGPKAGRTSETRADQTGQRTDRRADESVANNVQGLQIVTGVNMLPLEKPLPSFA